ncbi:uncharacterized protein LOC122319801 [Drosophila ficusphila]|uniref:uncharacterized protein LOC122319801 n=1 Tax=Drosophila ficusphila TaxID=30025 RepID=UPI001C8A01CA|nr:uncharacterized protein LOC122319801 [Drosophila ficusphila]
MVPSASQLDEAKRQRANVKRNISRIKSVVNEHVEEESFNRSAAELQCRLGILESYFKQALVIQTKIETLDSAANGRVDIEESYIATKLAIKQLLGENLSSTMLESNPPALPQSKLPRLPLPTFDGTHTEYKNFMTSFMQLTGRENLSSIEKFNHLLNYLKGPGLEAVKAFPVTSENFPKALDRLKARYDKPGLIFMETMTTIFKLQPVNSSNAQQLRSLIDISSALFSSQSSLGSDAQISEAMLIYLVMDKCDQQTRNKWNESLDYSSLPSWTFALTKTTCVFCSSAGHRLMACDQLRNLDSLQRLEVVKKQGLCVNCLGKGHKVSNCPSKNRCRSCNQPHHTLLHHHNSPKSLSLPSTSSSQPSGTAAYSQPQLSAAPNYVNVQPYPIGAATHAHAQSDARGGSQVILATAMVQVQDSIDSFRLGRALLDSCSQVNFITEAFAHKLRFPRDKHSVQIRSIGDSNTHIKHRTSTTIKSRLSLFELSLDLCITPNIAYQPDTQIDISNWNLPPNTPLADEQFHLSRNVDMLLGAEAFYDILAVGQVKLGSNLPTLQKTLFGWVVAGSHRPNQSKESYAYLAQSSAAIDANLKRLWEVETISTSGERLKPEHKLYFSTSNAQYRTFMNEYEQMGHMELVANPNLSAPHYYVPHHCVLQPACESTKLRVIFDASCKTSSQVSLNDILLCGPTIQDDLVMLLLRFRLSRYALTADIAKMYRQVNVDISDRKFQYILWRDFPGDQLRTYQLYTITYGTASAPYLAVRSLHHLADLHGAEFPIGAAVIRTSFYVDDLITGADEISTLSVIKDQVTKLLERGQFPLTKWHSNHMDFVESRNNKDLNPCINAMTSALGVHWHQNSDALRFAFTPKTVPAAITKRTILSVASALYDPLGLLSPLIIVAKIILQELWLAGLSWDESVPQHLQIAWIPLEPVQTFRCHAIVYKLNTYQFKFTDSVTRQSEHMVAPFIYVPNASTEPSLFNCLLLSPEWPRAPHFGGLWEAAVKSAKGLLNRTLMNTRLTFEELTTVAAEVEAILNSRLLTLLSPDPSDFGAITPGHLLVGKPLRAMPERHITTANITNLQRFDVVTAIKQEFWRRWSAEYINELQARTK